MDGIILEFKDENGKVINSYSATGIKTGLVDRVFDLVSQEEKINKEEGAFTGKNLKSYFKSMRILLVDIYNKQFTLKELEDNAEHADVKACFYGWYSAILKN